VDDVRRLEAMQDHIHDGDDVGEGLFFPCRKRCGSGGWPGLRW
jgi:hypothetical protein